MVVAASALVRQLISEALVRAPDIGVPGTSAHPAKALAKMSASWPEVIVLDIDQPGTDGFVFLRRVMAERPTPVIVYAAFTAPGLSRRDALAAGAYAAIERPREGLREFFAAADCDIVSKVRAAAGANRRLPLQPGLHPPPPKLTADAVLPAATHAASPPTMAGLIALGTSTGGTRALESLLTRLPPSVAGIVIVQHMPERFTAMFAAHLDSLCAIRVREACANDRVLPGQALVAPGGRHLILKRCGAQYHVDVIDGPLVNRHRPSVDVLFRSVAKCAGRNALGVIMTGMGDDGAAGLREMRDAGAATIAQDEASSVVFGMPKAAISLGAVERVLALDALPAALGAFSSGSRR